VQFYSTKKDYDLKMIVCIGNLRERERRQWDFLVVF
jgi:hypothetical protein